MNPGAEIGLWDLDIGEWSQLLTHDNNIVDFQLHPNGSSLISLTHSEEKSEREILVWDLNSGKILRRYNCENQADRILVTSNGHHMLAVQDQKQVSVKDGS